MLDRYKEIKDFIPSLNSRELDEYTLTSGENRQVDALVVQMRNLESVIKRLQNDRTTISDVRDLFNMVIDDYEETEVRLSCTADIVQSPSFQFSIVKVQRGESYAMNREERTVLKDFEVIEGNNALDSTEDHSYDERALARRTTGCSVTVRKYIDLRFLLPTSNVCERLFSKSGYTLNYLRRGISPANLEAQLFLHMKKDL